ncbi:MAG: transglycosylase SLT domain-containing protein [Candidatus Eisenbacteria bacterium]|nr:transglycosylase SLT domain-containing protein [Candidatus Eisenbacteria bacterium]
MSDGEEPAGAGLMTEVMDEHLAREIATQGGIGLGDALERQFASRFDPDAPVRYRNVVSPVRSLPIPDGYAAAGEPAEPDTIEGRVERYDEIIREAASAFELEPELLRAVIAQESAGRPEATSPKGAKGLMQLMDGTAEEMGVRDSFDPEQNIRGGARYLRGLLDRFSGDLEKALAGYNAGPGAVERHDGVPPYRETRDYVSRVKRRMGRTDQEEAD